MRCKNMAHTHKRSRMIALAGLLGGLGLAGVPALAQTTAPTESQSSGGSMMNGMHHTQGGMMMNSEMQQKMSRMMDNCNRMMESMDKGRDTAPTAPSNKG